MNPTNPYQSPKTSEGGTDDRTVQPKRLPVWWSGGLLFIGVCNLLLLNGQVFTNTVVFLVFVAISAVLWLPILVRFQDEDHRRIALYVLFAHAVLVVFFATGLPELKRSQERRNEMREELRQRGRS